MKAFVHAGEQTYVTTMPKQELAEGEVRIAIKVAGLNRRDLYIPDRRGNISEPLIIGSDGAGVIHEVGEGVTDWKVGDEVIINPSLRWYENSAAPPAEFDILGMPDHGTFAEEVIIDAKQIEKKPTSYSWEEAGVLGLSALTGYRALRTQGNIQAGQTLFIPGGASGVATYIIQYAVALGARVIVTSRDEVKRQKLKELGVHVVLDTNADWPEELANETIDLVIDSVGAATFNRSLDVLKQGGKIVVFGATAGDTVDLDLRSFFYGQFTLVGSTMGSQEEFKEMIEFVEEHSIKPVIDHVYSLDETKKAFDQLLHSEQFGKIGLRIS